MNSTPPIRQPPGAPTVVDMLSQYEAEHTPVPVRTQRRRDRVQAWRNPRDEPVNKNAKPDEDEVRNRRAQLRELWQTDLSIKEIAKVIGCNPATIHHDIDALQLPKRRAGGVRRRAADAAIEETKRLHEEGLSPQEIADQMGCAVTTVRGRLKKAEVYHDNRRTAVASGIIEHKSDVTIVNNAITQMALFAELILQQGRPEEVSPELAQQWEKSLRVVGRASGFVRRSIKEMSE